MQKLKVRQMPTVRKSKRNYDPEILKKYNPISVLQKQWDSLIDEGEAINRKLFIHKS